MRGILDLDRLSFRLVDYMGDGLGLKEECGRIVVEILRQGSVPRGEVTRQIAGSERRGRELTRHLVDYRLGPPIRQRARSTMSPLDGCVALGGVRDNIRVAIVRTRNVGDEVRV